MRKILIILVLLITLFTVMYFSGCSMNKDGKTNTEQTEQTQKQEPIDILETTTIGDLKIGMKVTGDEIPTLGIPDERFPAQVEEATGKTVEVWRIGNTLEVTIASDSNSTEKYVDRIRVTDAVELETDRGIKIGSTKEEVVEKYKDVISADESTEDTIVAGSVYGGVIFTITDGKVSEIFIGAAAE